MWFCWSLKTLPKKKHTVGLQAIKKKMKQETENGWYMLFFKLKIAKKITNFTTKDL